MAFDQKRRRSNRILVLFMSEEALSQACERVAVVDKLRQDKRLPVIANHLVAQHRGTHFIGSPLDKFRNDPFSVLFSLNWQGINAVDQTGHSIVDHLIVSKLPFPPANERLVYEYNVRVGLQGVFEEAQWSLRQGIGRAMRDKSARFTLWICDPRMPLPDELVRFGYPKYMRQRENATQRDWYNNFDQLISLRLYGQYGGTGLFAKPVKMGYFSDNGLEEHDVHLASRAEDRIRITAE
jgi:Rad3-related DNA helicase